MLCPTPPERLCDPQGRPYFLWDVDLTLDEFRARLRDPAEHLYWLATLLRQAKPDDALTFVDLATIRQAVADLDREFLTIEATGDYARAQALMQRYVVIRPDVQKALDKMKAVPNDIRPAFVTAAALTGAGAR